MIKHQPYTECRTWYIVFERPRTKHWRWWRIFTGRTFAHCWAFTEAGPGVMYFEPLHWGICNTWTDTPIADMLLAAAQSDITALLSVTVDYKLCFEHVPRGPYSCVSALKALLGLRKCRFTITPFQLYKRLCGLEGVIPIRPYTPFIGG